MSYPTWPKDLVQFERSGWQAHNQDARRRRQTDAGPPGYRRRFSSVARIVTLSLVTDRNGKAIFDRFFEERCAYGAGLFWMPDPATAGWELLSSAGAAMLDGIDRPLLLAERWLCTFGDEPPMESVVGDSGFRIAFSLAVMP